MSFIIPSCLFSKSGGNSSSSVEDEVSASIRPLISSAGESIRQGEGPLNSTGPEFLNINYLEGIRTKDRESQRKRLPMSLHRA